uniref:Gag-pol polyprotein n=1 Tax=Mesocestoides corti TaxID=53468 RepID=A0A5K3G1D7_MESCO
MGSKPTNSGSKNVSKTSSDPDFSATANAFGQGARLFQSAIQPPEFQPDDNNDRWLCVMDDFLRGVPPQLRSYRLLVNLSEKARYRADQSKCTPETPYEELKERLLKIFSKNAVNYL